jgi:hypothetical protein
MRVARRFIAAFMASLIALFGVSASASAHAHDLAGGEPLIVHVLEDAHGDHHADHSHAGADQSDPSPDGDGTTEHTLHVHGCSHAATVNDVAFLSLVEVASVAVWTESAETFRTRMASPPRKPPRDFI